MDRLESFVRSEWFITALSVVVILGVTALVSWTLTKFLRKLLQQDNSLLPSSSIFVNIARAAVWILGICVMLGTCFNVNVSAAIAALGVGGIAISLGFQDTISNLIGGLQVSLMKIIKPGDNIEVNNETGVVKDVTWRHTTIVNPLNETVIIPNSIIGKNALTKLPPTSLVVIKFVVRSDGSDLDGTAAAIEAACEKAASAVTKVTQKPKAIFTEITEFGFRGKVTFKVSSASKATEASDAALRAIAPITRPAHDSESKQQTMVARG